MNTDARDIRNRDNIAAMEVSTQHGPWLVRGDGLMQFPIGRDPDTGARTIMSVNFGFAAGRGYPEVALMRSDTMAFVTRPLWMEVFGTRLYDDVVTLATHEFPGVLAALMNHLEQDDL